LQSQSFEKDSTLFNKAYAPFSINYNQYSNFRQKTISLKSDTILLDTLSIFPNSLSLQDAQTGKRISTEQYTLDYTNGKLIFKNGVRPEMVQFTYRTFPVKLSKTVQHKNPVIIRKGDSIFYDRFYYQPVAVQTASFLDFGGLNYSGNFARGIQFGSNQDLSLTSNLDLRLSGKIGNDIEITAALTDNTIPLQPDGTTQQLQDFDKVYIQLKKDPHLIIAGDYNLKSFDSYFMKFAKQLQGGSYVNDLKFKKAGIRLQTSTSLAVSRGKFARNVFQGAEGNQGPYRLVGNNSETFLIILAGSEKVYVDGVRLQRGELLDYVMDYNSGEVVFMPRFLITKDSRIVVEFEYTDRNYFRTTVHEGINFEWKKLKIYTQVYSEQDAKNKPITNSLSDSLKAYLSNIGNDISNAYTSGIRETTFDPNRVQYRIVDTTVNAISYDSVFVYETNPDSAKYLLNFSFVGTNKGNYIPEKNSNNVRVYRWIAPVGGIPQGSYEPVILIVTPKNQLLFTFGASYDINSKMKVKAEMAFSNFDKNLFSSIGNKENKGYAATMQLNRVDSFKHNFVFSNSINYEFKQDKFQQIEPYRNVEFTRDWNILNQTNLTEHIARYQSDVYDVKHNIRVGYRFSTFIRQKKYQGFENRVNFSTDYKNIKINADARILNTEDSLYKTIFFRPTINATYSLAKVRGLGFGIGFFQENNTFRNKETKTLQLSSFKNNNLSFRFFLPDSAKWSFMLEYKYRKDVGVRDGLFKDSTTAHTVEFHGAANQLKNQSFNWTFTFRDLLVKDTLVQAKPELTFLGRTEYGARIKKGVVRLNFIYELGGGRERVRQYTYVQVSSGLGYYKWIDQNTNGIRELNEFVPSQFSDSAQFVRVLTDLNEYVRANSTAYTQSINIQPKVIWFNEKGFKKFMSKLTFQSYLQIRRKSYKANTFKVFNPFVFKTNDSNTITLNSNVRNSFIFNAGDPIYSFSFTNQLANDKVLLINGFDTRKRMDNILEGYYNLSQKFTLNMKFIQSKISLVSDFFHANDYIIRGYYVEPKFTYNYKTLLRTSVSYGFTQKKNEINLGGEKTLANKLELELRYSKATKNTLETKFTLAIVKYTGENGTTKSYTILEGLQPGNNYIWSGTYTRNISQNLELSLTYEGRKTGTAKLVNTGRAQLRAVF
jgi:hypothetical protein